jgi:hypothetical protein
MKDEYEFFAAHDRAWEPGSVVGTDEKVLSQDPDDPEILTRLVRWQPGFDIALGRSFAAGHYASRRPHMPHGPYRTTKGCTMLEIRYRS